MSNDLILIVEDERQLAEVFRAFFEREGFRVVEAADGDVALDLHKALSPDLIVLDVKLPRRDGIDVLAELRRRGSTPVIMSTALGQDLEKLTALKIGADDYIVKPFNPLELVARAKAVLRRTKNGGSDDIVRIGGLEIDRNAHEVRTLPDLRPLAFTPTEFRILVHMARYPRKAFSRGELVDACLPGEQDALEQTVTSHIGNLRAKLETVGLKGLLQVVRGTGYRLAPPT